MSRAERLVALAVVALILAPGEAGSQSASGSKAEGSGVEAPVVTTHEIEVGGAALRYEATTGYLPLRTEGGDLKARVFFIAYRRSGVADVSRRPVTFAFNGGPGSSSVWLHLGAIGPKRVRMSEEGWAPPPPYRLEENEGTWLAFSDLVFIDPVMTGYSRPAAGEEKGQFHGLSEDVEWVGEFIRLYTTRYERWSSPKFLAGESYGTTRAAGLSRHLQERHGLYLNGVVLISAVLDFQTLRFGWGNDLPYPLFLPSYTATAWYHDRLPPEAQGDLPAILAEAREFALADYSVALMRGADLAAEERREIVRRLARFTGLSERVIEENDLRITQPVFARELLRDEGLRVGRLDSRFKGLEPVEGGFGSDPSYAAIQGPYTATLNAYVREELGYQNDLPYEILTGRVRPWNWGSAAEGYPNVADDLRHAMIQNPALRVLVASGYYDLATPFFAAEYTVAHLATDPSLRRRFRMTYYPAGHMMYIHEASLLRLRDDVQAFVQEALSAPEGR